MSGYCYSYNEVSNVAEQLSTLIDLLSIIRAAILVRHGLGQSGS
mgnify:CR=1 FL=1